MKNKEFHKNLWKWLKSHLPIRIRIQTLHVYEGSDARDWFVAFDEMDAIKAWMEWTSNDTPDGSDVFNKVKDRSPFKVNLQIEELNELSSRPLFSKLKFNEKGKVWVATAPAWCWALYNGRGFLCSTEY